MSQLSGLRAARTDEALLYHPKGRVIACRHDSTIRSILLPIERIKVVGNTLSSRVTLSKRDIARMNIARQKMLPVTVYLRNRDGGFCKVDRCHVLCAMRKYLSFALRPESTSESSSPSASSSSGSERSNSDASTETLMRMAPPAEELPSPRPPSVAPTPPPPTPPTPPQDSGAHANTATSEDEDAVVGLISPGPPQQRANADVRTWKRPQDVGGGMDMSEEARRRRHELLMSFSSTRVQRPAFCPPVAAPPGPETSFRPPAPPLPPPPQAAAVPQSDGAQVVRQSRFSTEVRYKGVVFRSILEARHARLFDLLNVAWSYEPMTFQVQDAATGKTQWYKPDFYLHDLDVVVEIKPAEPYVDQCLKCEAVARQYNKDVVLMFGKLADPADRFVSSREDRYRYENAESLKMYWWARGGKLKRGVHTTWVWPEGDACASLQSFKTFSELFEATRSPGIQRVRQAFVQARDLVIAA